MLLTRRGALGALSVATLTALTACGRDAGAADPNASSDLVGEKLVFRPGLCVILHSRLQQLWVR